MAGFYSFNERMEEIILAAHFNGTGTRIVLCSADHRIRVYNVDQSDDYFLIDQWRGHDAEVLDASIFLFFCHGHVSLRILQIKGPMACIQLRPVLCYYRRRQQVQVVARRPITSIQKWTTLQVHFLAVAGQPCLLCFLWL